MVSAASVMMPYCGLTTADRWLTSWNFDPIVIAAIAAVSALTLHGPRNLRHQRWTGVALMAMLWISPLCATSATLLSVRVAHHMALMLLLAPALALGWPSVRLGDPLAWAIGASLALAGWFVPSVYSFAWQSDAAYWALQLMMLGAAWQFWATWFAPATDSRPLVAVAAPALLAMAMGFTGALLTFAPHPLFAEHIFTTVLFDVAPLWDQQLAGLLMWTAGMVPMALLAFVRLGRLAGAPAEGARC